MKIKSKIKRILSGVMAACMSLTVTSGILPEWIFGANTFATVASADGYEMTAEECIEQNGSHHFRLDSCDYDAGMQRFQLQKHCTRCGFDQMDYHTARYMVQPYVGYYDGEEHGIYFVLPTDPAGGENDDRSNKVSLGGYGINGKAPSGQFYKSNPSDAFSEEPITVSESGYTPVIWKVWFKLDVSRCVDEYSHIYPDGWANGYAEGASYILILSNEDDNAPGTGGGTGGGSGGGTGGGSGGSGGTGSSTSTLEQLHEQGQHTEDMYHFHHTEPATCERDGFDVFECRFCGKTISRNIYPKVGHSYDTYTPPYHLLKAVYDG